MVFVSLVYVDQGCSLATLAENQCLLAHAVIFNSGLCQNNCSYEVLSGRQALNMHQIISCAKLKLAQVSFVHEQGVIRDWTETRTSLWLKLVFPYIASYSRPRGIISPCSCTCSCHVRNSWSCKRRHFFLWGREEEKPHRVNNMQLSSPLLLFLQPQPTKFGKIFLVLTFHTRSWKSVSSHHPMQESMKGFS